MSATRVGLLFPGQGAQGVGMGRALYDRVPLAREMFADASRVLGYDLADLCFQGPESRLNATEFSQPALFVTSMVAYEVFRLELPEVAASVVACAGLSLGEYTAVCVSGVLPFDEALDLVQRRGRAMQRSADQVQSGMASVLGLEVPKVTELCREAAGAHEVCVPANLLCPGNIVVSGHLTALKRFEALALNAGAMKVIPLTVAGAFHTSLMQPAVAELTAALLEKPLTTGRIPVISNVDAKPHTHPQEIRELLAKQVVSPVLWESCIRCMLASGVEKFIEVGTGRVLRGILKRIDRKVSVDGFGEE